MDAGDLFLVQDLSKCKLKSQSELGEECSGWLYGRVIEVCFLVLELSVKEIGRTHCEEAIALWQTVIDRGID